MSCLSICRDKRAPPRNNVPQVKPMNKRQIEIVFMKEQLQQCTNLCDDVITVILKYSERGLWSDHMPIINEWINSHITREHDLGGNKTQIINIGLYYVISTYDKCCSQMKWRDSLEVFLSDHVSRDGNSKILDNFFALLFEDILPFVQGDSLEPIQFDYHMNHRPFANTEHFWRIRSPSEQTAFCISILIQYNW